MVSVKGEDSSSKGDRDEKLEEKAEKKSGKANGLVLGIGLAVSMVAMAALVLLAVLSRRRKRQHEQFERMDSEKGDQGSTRLHSATLHRMTISDNPMAVDTALEPMVITNPIAGHALKERSGSVWNILDKSNLSQSRLGSVRTGNVSTPLADKDVVFGEEAAAAETARTGSVAGGGRKPTTVSSTVNPLSTLDQNNAL